YALKELPDESSYINIGCVATESRDIEITDTVYVDGNQLAMLKEISACHDIFVHKVPWEMPVNIKGFDISSHGGNK
ncbi:MAG: hypothetical protein IJD28_01555, partial [Deferribacterales bacterium]|nr:hypothetical protein [Deferribacterales bacterium]